MNDFRLERYRAEYLGGDVEHGVVVLIDGADLFSLVDEASTPGASPGPWMPYEVVAGPSRHWLGDPAPGFLNGRLVAVLDGSCRVWQCCGLGAEITFESETVVWAIPGLETLVFDRLQYETEIDRLPTMDEHLCQPTEGNP